MSRPDLLAAPVSIPRNGAARWGVWLMVGAGVLTVELGLRPVSTPAAINRLPLPQAVRGEVEALRAAPLEHVGDVRAAAVMSGVVFGRTDDVDPRDEAAFLDSGLWHLLAASGQNIALVAGCCVLCARALRRTRVAGAVAALVAIPAYVLVVGGGASILRAGIMGELALLAWLCGRLPDIRHSIPIAAACIVWAYPGAHRLLGFQLSFACVAMLVTYGGRLARALTTAGVPRPLAAGSSATITCSGATAPLLMLHTGAVPVTGAVANLIAVPLASVLLVGGLASSLISLAVPPLGEHAVGLVGVVAQLLLEVAHRAAALPAAQSSSPAVGYGIPAIGLLLAHARPRWRLKVAAVGAALILAAWLVTGPMTGRIPGLDGALGRVPPPRASTLRFDMLDVGQGDATLIRGGGHAVLVDTGPPGANLVAQLRKAGVRRLDGIVVSHDATDHHGGLAEAVRAFRPDWVAVPAQAPGSWRRVRELGPRTIDVCAGHGIPIPMPGDDADLQVLHPPCAGPVKEETGDAANDNAVVLIAEHRSIRVLLPADAEAPILRDLQIGRVHLLKVSHHGSKDPQLKRMVDELRPAAATISAGRSNTYGHPAPSVLTTLGRHGIPVHRTDREGTGIFESDGRRLVRIQ